VKLWVLRHGQAEAHAATDAERNLTAHGREEVLGSAAQLIGKPIDAIIASPYVRAQQTAHLVREALGFAGEIRTVPCSRPRPIHCRCWSDWRVPTTCYWSAISPWSAT